MADTKSIPIGFCQCGCGRPTSIAAYTDRYHGYVAGEPIPFIRGHNTRTGTGLPVALVCATCGRGFRVRPGLAEVRRFCSRGCYAATQRVPREVAFWRHVNKTDTCWLWTGARSNRHGQEGYGQFGKYGESQQAHRISWELANGPIPDGLCVLHHCDVRPCVNPAHLFLGTKKDNSLDAVSKGRLPHGSGSKLAKLTEEQVIAARAMRQSGASARSIASLYGVAPSTIKDVLSRRQWKHVP